MFRRFTRSILRERSHFGEDGEERGGVPNLYDFNTHVQKVTKR